MAKFSSNKVCWNITYSRGQRKRSHATSLHFDLNKLNSVFTWICTSVPQSLDEERALVPWEAFTWICRCTQVLHSGTTETLLSNQRPRTATDKVTEGAAAILHFSWTLTTRQTSLPAWLLDTRILHSDDLRNNLMVLARQKSDPLPQCTHTQHR